jgi:hypothetical protein
MSPSFELSSREPAKTGAGFPLLLILSADLMLASRLEAPARDAGFDAKTVASLDALRTALAGQSTALVLIDLSDTTLPFAAALDIVTSAGSGVRCLGIYPHVRDDLGKDASARGCGTVLPRSRFFADIAGALRAASGTRASAAAKGESS